MDAVNIIGCGPETGSKWDGSGPSIGVNDCYKWGYDVDHLLVLDMRKRFTYDRQDLIDASKPRMHFLTCEKEWLRKFYDSQKVDQIELSIKQRDLFCINGPEIIRYRFSPWKGELRKDRICFSRTSPFVAIYYAWFLGYKEMILWGVDFQSHKSWHPGGAGMEDEIKAYKELFIALQNAGIVIYLGERGTIFDEILPIHKIKIGISAKEFMDRANELLR